MMRRISVSLLGAVILLLAACQSTYYNAMEKVGVHKRDILVSRVEKARDTQEETKEQFQSALEQFSSVLGFQGGELQEQYETLNKEYERSEALAEEVRERIAAVESVSEALFDEWQSELGQYTNASMRRASERQLADTRQQYQRLLAAMKKAEQRIEPVLSVFRDQVLFLKHNLNAQAIASLKGELVSVETDVARLVREMEASINEANRFIASMNRE